MNCIDDKVVNYDTDGYDLITEALRALMRQYPGLARGEDFMFSTAPTGSGKAIFPTTGAVIQSESESITGHVTQMCLYPFTVLFRASGLSQKNRVGAKEWLDTLGRWLEKQIVKIDGKNYVIEEYPPLSGRGVYDEYYYDRSEGVSREIRNIVRQTPAYLSTINDDKSEDWVISMTLNYRNEFDR